MLNQLFEPIKKTIRSYTPEDYLSWIKPWVSHWNCGYLIGFQGVMGVGKSTLIRALLRQLGVRGAIKSPTYALVEPYSLPGMTIYHLDFYRVMGYDELTLAGIRDCFDGLSTCLVEWPERIEKGMICYDLWVRLEWFGEAREITIEALTNRGQECLQNWPKNILRNGIFVE